MIGDIKTDKELQAVKDEMLKGFEEIRNKYDEVIEKIKNAKNIDELTGVAINFASKLQKMAG